MCYISAFSFELVLRQVRARYVLGLTATPTRKDGHHPIIFMQCGPIRSSISPAKAANEREFEHRVVVRKTGTATEVPEDEAKIHDVYNAILNDEERTRMIAEDVRKSVKEGRSPLILTERRNHLDSLAEALADLGDHLYVLHGGLREKKRREVMDAFMRVPEGEKRVLLATGKYIGEGFDDVRLDTLFLTSPISWKGILQQYAGRLHRAHHAKKEVIIYDYVDNRIPMARRMFARRKKGYANLGYAIEHPSQGALAFD
jgi:superfamily II DNA or RNA helicase